MQAIKLAISLKWPHVKTYNCDDLQDNLKDQNSDPVVLLDLRSEEEYNVSHIQNAILVDPSEENVKNITDLILRNHQYMDKPLNAICYCAVGYRSSKYANFLQNHIKDSNDQNSKNIRVYNLDGSLFEWANKNYGLLVDKDGKQTLHVHPVSVTWGKLLKKELHSHSP